jgi:hypothetical protein
MNPDRVELTVGATQVELRQKGCHRTTVAKILGRQTKSGGGEILWLDRLIHPGGDMQIAGGFVLSGAVSTIIQTD